MENLQLEKLKRFEIPGMLRFDLGRGALPRANITTAQSRAEIYLHGAHVTGFQKNGEPPLLFLSELSRFEPGRAIRGGIPICFPWFGTRPGEPAHGFARVTEWELTETAAVEQGGITLRLSLPKTEAGRAWPPMTAEFQVTVTDRLLLELTVVNRSADQTLRFEECLHTYFAVGEVSEISITGLESREYRDHTDHDAARTTPPEPLRVRSQTDRMYLDHTGSVEILDPILRRKIRIEKNASASTVVWNPWTTQVLEDLGPQEYRHMVCVESGNVNRNGIELSPGATAQLGVTIQSES